MAKRCDICGKGTQFGNIVSKSMNHTRRTWKPNLSSAKVQTPNGTVGTIKICTRCAKTVFDSGLLTKKVRINKSIAVKSAN